MNCLSCKNGDMKESVNSYIIEAENKHIIIENVPCLKCSKCEEVFYKMSVLEKIDSIFNVFSVNSEPTNVKRFDYRSFINEIS